MPDPLGTHHLEPSSGQEQLVRTLVREGITDERVLEAFRLVRRDQFVPPESRLHAYEDRPLPIAHGQVTTQPSLIARMLEGLRLSGGERVLEVGTGLGFQTAILSVLVREVVTVERFADLAERARLNLDEGGVRGVRIVVGDGTLGVPEQAPYGGIVVAAASPVVPEPLIGQLDEGGRLVQPMGPGGAESVMAFKKERGGLVEEAFLTGAHFVRLIGAHGQAADAD
jgi:protein-L-isoaspartate(D-aspartate) O-methyltransferase